MPDSTVVLIHGAFADASSWRGVYTALVSDGIEVRAPANPLRGVSAGDGAFVQSVLATIDGPVVLVGHSYGGVVITAAGHSDNVVGLVYVSGFAPDEGEQLGGLLSKYPSSSSQYMSPSPGPDGGQEFSVDPTGFHEVFCADLPADEAAFLAVSQRTISAVALGETAGAPAWRVRPSWAVLPTADEMNPPELQHFLYDRMGAEVTVVDGASHVSMVSQPNVVAEVVRQAVARAHD